jgi:hypothetical protein
VIYSRKTEQKGGRGMPEKEKPLAEFTVKINSSDAFMPIKVTVMPSGKVIVQGAQQVAVKVPFSIKFFHQV